MVLTRPVIELHLSVVRTTDNDGGIGQLGASGWRDDRGDGLRLGEAKAEEGNECC